MNLALQIIIILIILAILGVFAYRFITTDLKSDFDFWRNKDDEFKMNLQ